MKTQLEDRLVQYRGTLDGAIDHDLRHGDRPVRERSRVPLVAAAAVAVLSVVGLVAVSRGDGDTSSADSTVSAAAASPTDGLLPRLLLDPALGWEVREMEDYLLRDSGGAFTRVFFVKDSASFVVVLRRMREGITVGGSNSEQYGRCGAHAVEPFLGDSLGYAFNSPGDGGVVSDGASFTWAIDANIVLSVIATGLAFDDAERLARGLVAASDEEWAALRASVDASALITDPADQMAAWQLALPGRLEVVDDDGWHWELVFCTDPA